MSALNYSSDAVEDEPAAEMACFASTARSAFRGAARNRAARWEAVASPDASGRVGGPVFLPEITPAFEVDRSKPVFAIGSCFAQEVQLALAAQQFDLVTMITDAPEEEYFLQSVGNDEKHFWPLHFFHRYNLPSMRQEIRRVVDDTSPLNGDALLFDAGGISDFHYHEHFRVGSIETARARRRYVRERLSRIRQAGLAVLTLGLTEAWYDHETGLFLNTLPHYGMTTAQPNRFEFMVLSWKFLHDELCGLIEDLRAIAPDIKIVITVSPIPLDATFAPNDVAVSTMHSKATLLSVAREVAYATKDVAYFPSYEMAMLSDRANVWKEDQRHVRPEFVKEIMGRFVGAYVKD